MKDVISQKAVKEIVYSKEAWSRAELYNLAVVLDFDLSILEIQERYSPDDVYLYVCSRLYEQTKNKHSFILYVREGSYFFTKYEVKAKTQYTFESFVKLLQKLVNDSMEWESLFKSVKYLGMIETPIPKVGEVVIDGYTKSMTVK